MTAVPSPIDLIDAIDAIEPIEPPLSVNVPRHQVPPLMYGYMALEPCISARTMRVHHDMHHGAYVDALNDATQGVDKLKTASALWLLCNLSKVPSDIRGAIHHSAGGHVNHGLFWRAIVTEPAVVLADEPTGNLDTQRSHEIMGLLMALNRDHGITVLMVTHELDMAKYARRMVHFIDGRVARDAPNLNPTTQAPAADAALDLAQSTGHG